MSDEKKLRSYTEIIVDAFRDGGGDIALCLLHENATNVRTVKAGTNVTIGIPPNLFTPNDALWFSGALGRSEARKPKYVGVLVFIPTDKYENAPEPEKPPVAPEPPDDRIELLCQSPMEQRRNSYRHGWADGWRAAKGVKE